MILDGLRHKRPVGENNLTFNYETFEEYNKAHILALDHAGEPEKFVDFTI